MTDETLNPPYLTVDAVAQRWAVNHHTVRRMIDAGQLAAMRIGRILRIEQAEVLRVEAVWKQELDASRQSWNQRMAARKAAIE